MTARARILTLILDPSQSPLAKACQTYPHLYAFMRLHTFRPLIAQRLHEYLVTALELTVCRDAEVEYFRKHLVLAKERYTEVTLKFHELLVEIVMLNAKHKAIQEQCLRLIHVPLPVVGGPPLNIARKDVAVWFDTVASEIDDQIKAEYLQLIDQLILMQRGGELAVHSYKIS